MQTKLQNTLTQMQSLLNELEGSRALESLWPNCFETGKEVKACLIGTGQHGGLLEPSKLQFRITVDSEERRFNLASVPLALANQHLRLAIDKIKDSSDRLRANMVCKKFLKS